MTQTKPFSGITIEDISRQLNAWYTENPDAYYVDSKISFDSKLSLISLLLFYEEPNEIKEFVPNGYGFNREPDLAK